MLQSFYAYLDMKFRRLVIQVFSSAKLNTLDNKCINYHLKMHNFLIILMLYLSVWK